MNPKKSPSNWVLVTGGAKRLGRDFCLQFARNGWNVVCHYGQSAQQALQTAQDIRAYGVDCHILSLDLAAGNVAKQIMDSCVALIGRTPQCVINNASIFLEDDASCVTEESMLKHFSLNTMVPLLLGCELRKHILALEIESDLGHACVIHVLDQKVHNLNPDYFSYTVSKLALERSVALQAQALAPQVRVCGLSPGLIDISGNQSKENFSVTSRMNLMKKRISPADVAQAAFFIATNASLTGCTIQSDNGQHLVASNRDVMFLHRE